MATMQWDSGDTITAARLQDMVPILVIKTSATSRASTTTATADPDLVVTLRPNVTYLMKVSVCVIGAAAGDFKMGYSVTGTLTETGAMRTSHGMATTGGDPRDTANVRADGGTGTTTIASTPAYGTHATARNNVEETFIIAAGASGGVLSLIWAQQTSDVTATQITKGYILATPVNQV